MEVQESEFDDTGVDDNEDDVEDMAEGDDREEDEEDAKNNDSSRVEADEERDKNGDNEDDGPTRPWENPQDNFEDFQFEMEEDDQGLNSSDIKDEGADIAGLWGDGDKIICAKINKDRRFVCIDYPGVVQNVDKALRTMEGIQSISKVLFENGRMPLYFRPGDPYCKATYANCQFSQNLLVRVRRRKKKKPLAVRDDISATVGNKCNTKSDHTVDGLDEPNSYEYQLVIEGIVDRMYSFDALCDFQYLPMVKSQAAPESGDGQFKYTEILSKLVPGFEDQRAEYLSRDVPLFLPPLHFSRRPVPVPFLFENDSTSGNKMDLGESDRKQRTLGTFHMAFHHTGVPAKPHPEGHLSLDRLPKSYQQSGLEAIKKLFKERPVWSKAALQVVIEPVYKVYVTYLLPMVAFYFTSGAWKSLWCRFGYDPRTLPASKIYQVVDFRIRRLADHTRLDHKRDLQTKGLLKVDTAAPEAGSDLGSSDDIQFHTNLNATYAAKMGVQPLKESVYVYRHGVMPPFRQMRYQVCDIHHPDIQAKCHENDGKETVCIERDGWCVPDFTDICRDILRKEVEKLQATTNKS
ncbi:general transcription factor 3c polypeptide 5 [Plakobranchus ocellatus]|uniref:General transcription factor 3c polypeptide 5 n=1 Tax=Plakobranchus ocellatus TaxID=259542 RepID=A0AAV3ZXU9_9GAST|nr:general transcription factor 3c polypeptide 5 [Plakobranchus ocellatus]